MLRRHVAFHLPQAAGEMVLAEALDSPGAVTQAFDLADARVMKLIGHLEHQGRRLDREGAAFIQFGRGRQHPAESIRNRQR
jgi:hypothetical protein